jgi:hypothetical protein
MGLGRFGAFARASFVLGAVYRLSGSLYCAETIDLNRTIWNKIKKATSTTQEGVYLGGVLIAMLTGDSIVVGPRRTPEFVRNESERRIWSLQKRSKQGYR